MKKYYNIGVILALGTLSLYVWSFQGRRFLEKYPMTWRPSDWQNSETLLLIIAMALSAVLAWNLITLSIKNSKTELKFDPISGTLLVGNLSLVVLALLLLVLNRDYLANQIEELGHIALLQEFFIFGTLILLVMTFLRGKIGENGRVLFLGFRLVIGAMIGAVALLFLEEISWGQHYFGWATPDLFEGNIQEETNFHNFYTYRFEFVYYTAAFLVFAIAPLVLSTQSSGFTKQIQFYLPPVSFGIAALPITALMFENWCVLPFQIYLLMAIFTVIFILPYTAKTHRLGCALLLFLLVVHQPLVLTYGHLLKLGYEMSEVKELIIAFTLFMYAVWIFNKIRRIARASSDKSH